MPNSADGTTWTESQPANTDARNLGAQEIRGLRTGLRTRLEKEHVLPAASNVGGEHIAGSAVAYRQDGEPTNRPDPITSTSLTSADNGRLWFDSNDNNKLYVYADPDWVAVGAIASINTDMQTTDILSSITNNGTTGWVNNTGFLAFVTITALRIGSVTRQIEVQDVSNNFRIVLQSIFSPTLGGDRETFVGSFFVPDGNAARLTSAVSGFSGLARYAHMIVT